MAASHFPAPSNRMTSIGGGEQRGGKRGRGSPNKTPFVAAVSVNGKGRPIAMNMNVVNGFRPQEIAKWAKRHLVANSLVASDGLACFADAGCQHIGVVTGGGPECVSLEALAWANTMISNVKGPINGAYHAIDHKHPPAIPPLCYVAARTPPMPMRLLKMAEFHG